MKYDHIGIPLKNRKEGMIYIPEFKVWSSKYETDPFRVEWLFFEEESPFPLLIKTSIHLCFEVEDIEEMSKSKALLFPITAYHDCRFCFFEHEGFPIEFIELA